MREMVAQQFDGISYDGKKLRHTGGINELGPLGENHMPACQQARECRLPLSGPAPARLPKTTRDISGQFNPLRKEKGTC